jgi:hypothetical protein
VNTSAILLLVAAALAACGERSGSEAADMLPAEIHGLALTQSESGETATSMIAQLHASSVAPEQSQIGIYTAGTLRAILYVSRFATSAEADSQLVLMATRIGEGSPGYGHFRSFELPPGTVYQAFGNGQIHYFYAQDSDVTWLAAPPDMARPILAELLNLEVTAIPPLVEEGAMPQMQESTDTTETTPAS